MRILLTGAAGFIASAVAIRLLDEGHEVVGLDNLNDAYDVRLKEWRLRRLMDHAAFTFSLCDISDLDGLQERWKRRGPFDAVIDLAARAGVRQSMENPWIYISTNATGTLNLLELCRRFETPKFVLASSSSVYGRSKALPYTESDATSTPISPYAASKIAAEALAHSYHHLYQIDVTVLRYFTVYGPAGRPDMSPFRFIRWIAEDEPVCIMGDGHQSRDYTYVEDIAEGTIAAIRRTEWAIVNLGSDAPTTLLQMARLVEEALGKEAQYVFEQASEADVRSTWANIAVARQLLAWSPRTSLRDGLRATVDWYLENRELMSRLRLA